MTSKRCPVCIGGGEIMGGGMIMKDCPNCDGYGTITEGVAPSKAKAVSVDRRSRSYRDAITKIMDLHKVDREEAVKIFDEEFNALDK